MKYGNKVYRKENNLLCKLIGHKWEGCKCRNCIAKRDQEHSWKSYDDHETCGKICRKCNKLEIKPHDFKLLRNECFKQCTKCGYKTAVDHTWNYCVCTVCGKKQNYNHHFVGPKCNRVCDICGKEESHLNGNSDHEWIITGCEARCSKCGKTVSAHTYQLIRHDISYGTGKCPKAYKNDDYICGFCDTPNACMQYPRIDTYEYKCTLCGHKIISDSELRYDGKTPDTYNNELPAEEQ